MKGGIIIKKLLTVFLSLTMALLPLSGCKSNGPTGQIIKYDIPYGASNLDPQFATDSVAQLIIENTFEGLYRQEPDGTLSPAVATGHEVSSDGLRYTFFLNKTLKWSDGTKLTARDFEFALKRMFNHQSLSPFAQNYNSIKNAQRILNGVLPYTELGVWAKDDFTLIIELDSKNPFLIQLLTSASAMPCNEKYVLDKRGKYGLDTDSIIFNGPFYVSSWNNDKHIYLRKNESYISKRETIAGGVNLYIGRGDAKQLFYDGKSDAYPIEFTDVEKLEEKDYSIISFDNTTWAIILNGDIEAFKNENLRKAITSSINRAEIKETLPKNTNYTESIVPPTMMVLDESYREMYGDVAYSELYEKSPREYLNLAMEELGINKLPKTTIDIVDTKANRDIVPILQRSWEVELSSYINTNIISNDEMNKKLESGKFEIALIRFAPTSSSPVSMLDRFISTSPSNYLSYQSEEFDDLLTLAASPDNIAQSMRCLKDAENLLVNSGIIAPIYNASTFYAMAEGVSGIEFYPFSTKVYFKYAEKIEK